MDYLLRDSYHASVEYGKFDHNRLINTLRILPQSYADTDEPALGLESGGLEPSEGLVVARYFMYKQVYLHPVRRAYDIHLIDFLKSWLPNGIFSIALRKYIETTDVEVLAAMRKAVAAPRSSNHVFARRIHGRDHFRFFLHGISRRQARR
jgi:HD superfamily phosphohydrolase